MSVKYKIRNQEALPIIVLGKKEYWKLNCLNEYKSEDLYIYKDTSLEDLRQGRGVANI